MSGQEWAALAITGTALSWLVWRWRRRGLDEDGEHDSHGCGTCPKGAAPEGERVHALETKNGESKHGSGPRVEQARAAPPTTDAGRPERPPPAHP